MSAMCTIVFQVVIVVAAVVEEVVGVEAAITMATRIGEGILMVIEENQITTAIEDGEASEEAVQTKVLGGRDKTAVSSSGKHHQVNKG